MKSRLSAVLEGAFDALPTTVTRLKRAPSDYLRHKRYYTFSEFNWVPSFLEVLLQVGADRRCSPPIIRTRR